MNFNYDDYIMVDKLVRKAMNENDRYKMGYYMDIRSDIYMKLDDIQTKRVNWYIDQQFAEKVGV